MDIRSRRLVGVLKITGLLPRSQQTTRLPGQPVGSAAGGVNAIRTGEPAMINATGALEVPESTAATLEGAGAPGGRFLRFAAGAAAEGPASRLRCWCG